MFNSSHFFTHFVFSSVTAVPSQFIYVKVKDFFYIKSHVSENIRFNGLHRIFNFRAIASVWLFNSVLKFGDVACPTWMGGTDNLRTETWLASHLS